MAPTFSYGVAASYIAKDHRYDPTMHVFHFNPHHRIQQSQISPGSDRRMRPESGQDAFFVSRIGDTGGVALGVADGVGGWMDSGVDPADFSHSLCDNMASIAYSTKSIYNPRSVPEPGPRPSLTARALLQAGYEAVCADPSVAAGGSTAVVGLLSPDGSLEVANLGDSGFVQLRQNAVHSASVPQVHAFNTPFQLSVVPPWTMARMVAFGRGHLSDLPRDAEVTRHSLQHGDVLVFASDGVWDNLFNQDILRLVSKHMAATGAWEVTDAGIRVSRDLGRLTRAEASVVGATGEEQQQQQATQTTPAVTLQSLLATKITSAAKAASVNRNLDGPFSKEVKKYFPRETWRGGKVDDICVVVAVVFEKGGPQRAESGASAQTKLKSRL